MRCVPQRANRTLRSRLPFLKDNPGSWGYRWPYLWLHQQRVDYSLPWLCRFFKKLCTREGSSSRPRGQNVRVRTGRDGGMVQRNSNIKPDSDLYSRLYYKGGSLSVEPSLRTIGTTSRFRTTEELTTLWVQSCSVAVRTQGHGSRPGPSVRESLLNYLTQQLQSI